MIDLQHLPFPTPGVRLVTMRINGCLLIFISAPPTCSSSKARCWRSNYESTKRSLLKSSHLFVCSVFLRKRPQRCFTCADLFLRKGRNAALLQEKADVAFPAPAVRPDTQRAEEFS